MVVTGDDNIHSSKAPEQVKSLFLKVQAVALSHRGVSHDYHDMRLFLGAHLIHILLNQRQKRLETEAGDAASVHQRGVSGVGVPQNRDLDSSFLNY